MATNLNLINLCLFKPQTSSIFVQEVSGVDYVYEAFLGSSYSEVITHNTTLRSLISVSLGDHILPDLVKIVEAYMTEPIGLQKCFLRSVSNIELMFYDVPDQPLLFDMQEQSKLIYRNLIEGVWSTWPGFSIGGEDASKEAFVEHILKSSLIKSLDC